MGIMSSFRSVISTLKTSFQSRLQTLKNSLVKSPQTVTNIVGSTPKWFQIATEEIGVHEVKDGENPRIIEYHSHTTLHADHDEVPWCSSFVCYCLEKAGYPSTKSAAAASYLAYGDEVKEPTVGTICVFTRKGGCHVGFYVSETADSINVLGGNQKDQVSIALFPKAHLLALRTPHVLQLKALTPQP